MFMLKLPAVELLGLRAPDCADSVIALPADSVIVLLVRATAKVIAADSARALIQ